MAARKKTSGSARSGLDHAAAGPFGRLSLDGKAFVVVVGSCLAVMLVADLLFTR